MYVNNLLNSDYAVSDDVLAPVFPGAETFSKRVLSMHQSVFCISCAAELFQSALTMRIKSFLARLRIVCLFMRQ